MNINNKTVFVSGGAGVIGSELVPKLISLGAKLIVGDLKDRPAFFPSNVIYIKGDLNYISRELLENYNIEVFVHLAATFERSFENYDFWEKNYWNNVRLSHHLMDIFKDLHSLKRVVFASSYLIYDPSLYQFDEPVSSPTSLVETDAILPRNLTGAAKFNHEIELRHLEQFRSEQFSIVNARIFRGYGRNSNDIISRFVRELISGNKITIYRPEGMFDYIYAADTAEGIMRLIIADHVTGIINLGTGISRKVQDIVDILKSHFHNMEVEYYNSDIPYEASQANMERFFKFVGWRPKYDLEAGIAEIISYERSNLEKNYEVDDKKNVLITSASAKVPLIVAFKNAMKKIGSDGDVIAADISPSALSRFVSDRFWQMPPIDHNSVDEIISYCLYNKIKCILPTRDGELSFWANYKKLFAQNKINVLISTQMTVDICLDKIKFFKYSKEKNYPVIPTSKIISDLDAQNFVVKEQFGSGSKLIGINLNKDNALKHAKNLLSPIYQPYIEGVEISVDAWIDSKHKVKGLVLRKRNLVVNGESKITTTFRNVDIEKQCIAFLEDFEFYGPVVLQAIIDYDYHLNIIECNPRFGGASTASIAVGLDSLYWSLLDSFGENMYSYKFIRSKEEYSQIRLQSDMIVRANESYNF